MKRIFFSLLLIASASLFSKSKTEPNQTTETIKHESVEEITKKALSQEKLSALIAAFEEQIKKNHPDKTTFEKDLVILKKMKGASTLSLIKLGNQLSDTVKNVLRGLYAHLDYGTARNKAVALASS